jgi:hypothetical protein
MRLADVLACCVATVATVAALPVWSPERLNTYVHCANESGPWSDEALAALKKASPRFVVQERGTGRFFPPANASTEAKMLAAAKQIKAVNDSIEVYMYNPVFPVVDWYSYGAQADADRPTPTLAESRRCGWAMARCSSGAAAAVAATAGAAASSTSATPWDARRGWTPW